MFDARSARAYSYLPPVPALAVDLDGLPVAARPGEEDGQPVHVGALARVAQPVEWIVEDRIAAGGLYLVAGSPKLARKSWLMLHLVGCVARGAPWLGMRTHARPAIYVALEDGRRRVERRCALLGYASPAWDAAPCMAAFGLGALARIEAELATGGPQPILAIVDPLAEIASSRGLDEITAADMGNLLRPYREWAHATGATIILVHHYRKAGDMMRGHTALNAGCDGWCGVAPAQGDADLLLLDWTLRDGRSGVTGARMGQPNGAIQIEAAEVPADAVAVGSVESGKRTRTTRKVDREATDRAVALAHAFAHPSERLTADALAATINAARNTSGGEAITVPRARAALRALLGRGLRLYEGREHEYELDPAHAAGAREAASAGADM